MSQKQPLNNGDVCLELDCTRTMCVWRSVDENLRKYQHTFGPEKNRVINSVMPKRAPSSRSLCQASVVFLACRIGAPVCMSLSCPSQRARS